MPRASYPGGSDREIFRTVGPTGGKSAGSTTELLLLAAVLAFVTLQLIW